MDNSAAVKLKSVATGSLRDLIISLDTWLRDKPYDIAVHLPFSQVIDPTTSFAKEISGQELTATIPLGILTGFPKGRLLVAIFDTNSFEELLAERLTKAGVKVLVKDDFYDFKIKDFIPFLNQTKVNKSFERKIVGEQQFEASKILYNKAHSHMISPYILLHEVRASAIATQPTQDAIHSNASAWFDGYRHAKVTSFDCLVVTKEHLHPILAVEYDGKGHGNDPATVKKDNLKNGFCERLGLPIVRIDGSYLVPNERAPQIAYENAIFFRGFLYEILSVLRKQRQHALESSKIYSKHIVEQLKLQPDITAEDIIEKILQDEKVEVALLSINDDYNERDYEDWCAKNYFKKKYGFDAKIKFTRTLFGAWSASLEVPALSLKPSITLCCPTLNAKLFGLDGDEIQNIIKKYMSRYLVNLANDAT